MAKDVSMRSLLLRVTAMVAVAAGLAACGGGGGKSTKKVTTPPPAAAPPLEDQFGVNFGTAFRVAANTDPRDPAPGDLIPICFTCDPVNIP